jgi:sarcosine oxidase subunit gamma
MGRLARGDRDGADGKRRVRFTEVRGRHIVQLGVFGEGAAALAPLVRSITGAPLPDSTREVRESGGHRLYRIAADQYWVVSPEAGAGRALERGMQTDLGTVTVLSGARVCLRLEGPAVREVLAHHVALDLDFREFPAGRFAQTGLDHAAVLLDRRAAECFELYLLSTFAASAWDLLVDSALPYGYSLAVLSADGEAGASPA